MFTKFEDIKFRDFIPTFEEKVAVVHEALSGDFPNFVVYPWNTGEKPSMEEVALVYKDKEFSLTQLYVPACLLLEKEVPLKFRDGVERQIDPKGYFKRLDETEKLLKMTFEIFVSTNPTLDEAVDKLIELAGDYWGERLTTKVARQHIKEMYPDKVWRGQIII